MRSGPVRGSRDFDPRHIDRIYNVPAVRAQRDRTRELLAAQPGDRVMDLGCGAGHLTADLARDVDRAGRVIGLDRQRAMLAATSDRLHDAGLAGTCDLALADAVALPIRDGACDGAVAVQVLEYVADVDGALAELHRVLRVGGRAVLVDTDWRSCVWATDDRDRTDAVLRSWEGHFAHPHLPTVLPRRARAAGFTAAEVHALPVVETATDVDTYSLGMAATIERFVEREQPSLVRGWRADVKAQARRGTYFFSLTRFAVVVTR